MPLPAIVGLTAIGGLITKVVEKVVDFFFSKLARKIGVISLIIAGMYTAVTVLFSIIGVYAGPLISSLPPDITSLIGTALPGNTLSCITAIISVEASCITYSLTIKSLEMQSRVA